MLITVNGATKSASEELVAEVREGFATDAELRFERARHLASDVREAIRRADSLARLEASLRYSR